MSNHCRPPAQNNHDQNSPKADLPPPSGFRSANTQNTTKAIRCVFGVVVTSGLGSEAAKKRTPAEESRKGFSSRMN